MHPTQKGSVLAENTGSSKENKLLTAIWKDKAK